VKIAARWAFATALAIAGVGHFVALGSFLPLVPSWLPLARAIVVVTGVMEIAFAAALVLVPAGARRRGVGWALAAFLVVVFAGNVTQAVSRVDTFGLDTDAARWGRLAFQPLLILWALWSTDAWSFPPRRDRL